MTPHVLIFILAAIGISETVYLIRKRIAGERPICVIGKECHKVLESGYNKIFGIPNDISGLIFYFVVSLLTALLLIGVEPLVWWGKATEIIILGGVLISLYFIYVQWRIIKVWCFRCLMSAFIIFLMGIIVLTK